uniref:JmjC domain-containing protein n=3 Tax=Phaeomonas parva TaxID=124430 RepID=A0A7S1UB23_9STRA|mmetsp:Transcript_39885/g.124734  ORF Transcript_39885/g.124734 Transcript_39885/m.124734 type:complete len:805 (+) Transcript_39885:212-2626(+)
MLVLFGGIGVVAVKRDEVAAAMRSAVSWDSSLPLSLNDLYGSREVLMGGVPPKSLWVPIELDTRLGRVTLCELSGKAMLEHSRRPAETPMFKDLVQKFCGRRGEGRRVVDLEVAFREAEHAAKNEGRELLLPTGFVFHESRVGSTLVANMLASVPRFLVWSESKPPVLAMLHCAGDCTRPKQIKMLRQIMTLMCNSPYHHACFFKFQSVAGPAAHLLREAWPETPYVFLFRNPVQTIMSHMKNSKQAPCLRSRPSPPPALKQLFYETTKLPVQSASTEEYCAAHLGYLCTKALGVLEQDAAASTEHVKGISVEYTALPEALLEYILPGHFGVSVGPSAEARMMHESETYSKGRSRGMRTWKDDSAKKEDAATDAVVAAANKLLQPSYDRLVEFSERHLHMVQARAKAVRGTLHTEPSGAEGDADAAGAAGAGGAGNPAWTAPEDWSGKAVPVDFRNTEGGGKAHWALFPRGEISDTGHTSPFEQVECPDVPEEGYPRSYPILNVTSNWPPDDTRVPKQHYGSLCRFDYETELDKCFAYRDAEVPFVVYNVPAVEETAAKWSDLKYLDGRLGGSNFRTEHSKDNHFMYWQKPRSKSSLEELEKQSGKWESPTTITKMDFRTWMTRALEGEDVNKELHSEHYYFRVGDNEEPWIGKEDLTIFNSHKNNLFMKDSKGQRGIHCRFGMRSVIAESHYDSSRNFVAQLGGARRWIMNAPSTCENMYLLPHTHPSGRHSAVDWSNPNLQKFAKFRDLEAFDVVLTTGDVLYVPAYWFHYIVSLGINFQCNSRSGKSSAGLVDIKKCGFQA